jgi:tRNA nucleotidyltransferase (CCA-adding enzyme)
MRSEQVIATHGNTDFDAFGAMLAARLLYPDAVVAVGTLNRNVRDFYRLHADAFDAVIELGRLELDAIRRLVVVEAASASRLGELEPVALDPGVEKVLFDHHGDVALPGWVAEENAVLSEDGALTTTLVGIVAERELTPTPLEVTAFALGIHEDTGSLTYRTTTQRDVDALSWCFRHGARQDLVNTYLHTPLAPAERTLLQHLLESLEPVETLGDDVLIAATSWPEYVDGVSNLAHKLVDLTDARALVLLVAMDERVFAVIRSRTDDVDAAAIAAALGGGGHPQAASAISRESLAVVRARVVEVLRATGAAAPLARDVMATPVRTVGPDSTVREAMTLCQRHGQSGVFVVEGERLVGGVSREDLDKATGHDLSHAPVRGIMSGHVVRANENATLAELRSLVTAAEDGRVAVVRNDVLVGIVSRADLLRALEGIAPKPASTGASIVDELRASARLRGIVGAVARLGRRADGVFLVGGTVRDILLGEASFDVDIAVEGDAIAFAYALADVLGGRATPHQRFGTAVVQYGDGERVDVVTTRTEFYDAPGALPTVERAELREDLFRRDFTINAMAASLGADDLGRLVDPYGGRADLDARALRVLHNLSFIDDPTRIFRGIRYEARYGFRFEDHTARLLRGCIEMGLVGDLSSSRLRDELVALLEDSGAADGIRRLGELGADRAVHPRLRGDDRAAALFSRAASLREELGVDIPIWRIGIAALAREMTSDEAYHWLDRLALRRRESDLIVGAVTVAPRLVERLRTDALEPAQVVALADGFAPDAPLVALALEDRPELRAYFERLRGVTLEIDGADLIAMGLPESPQIGEVLGEIRRRKLNGELEGRDAELAAARELVAASAPA